MDTELIKQRIRLLEARIVSGAESPESRTSLRRSVSQCKRRLAEFEARGRLSQEPSQLRDARLYRKAAKILRDQNLIAELDRQRAENAVVQSILDTGIDT